MVYIHVALIWILSGIAAVILKNGVGILTKDDWKDWQDDTASSLLLLTISGQLGLVYYVYKFVRAFLNPELFK